MTRLVENTGWRTQMISNVESLIRKFDAKAVSEQRAAVSRCLNSQRIGSLAGIPKSGLTGRHSVGRNLSHGQLMSRSCTSDVCFSLVWYIMRFTYGPFQACLVVLLSQLRLISISSKTNSLFPGEAEKHREYRGGNSHCRGEFSDARHSRIVPFCCGEWI